MEEDKTSQKLFTQEDVLQLASQSMLLHENENLQNEELLQQSFKSTQDFPPPLKALFPSFDLEALAAKAKQEGTILSSEQIEQKSTPQTFNLPDLQNFALNTLNNVDSESSGEKEFSYINQSLGDQTLPKGSRFANSLFSSSLPSYNEKQKDLLKQNQNTFEEIDQINKIQKTNQTETLLINLPQKDEVGEPEPTSEKKQNISLFSQQLLPLSQSTFLNPSLINDFQKTENKEQQSSNLQNKTTGLIDKINQPSIILPNPSHLINNKSKIIGGIALPPGTFPFLSQKNQQFTLNQKQIKTETIIDQKVAQVNENTPSVSMMNILNLQSSYAQRPQIQTGEIIGKTYHSYNSIGTLAPLISQDENLSLEINAKKVKLFHNKIQKAYFKNVLCFVEQSISVDESNQKQEISNNLTFILNQNEQIPQILKEFHEKNMLLGNILDFTIRQFRYLYILYAKSVVVIDFQDLVNAKAKQYTTIAQQNNKNVLKIVETIQLIISPSWTLQNVDQVRAQSYFSNDQHLKPLTELSNYERQNKVVEDEETQKTTAALQERLDIGFPSAEVFDLKQKIPKKQSESMPQIKNQVLEAYQLYAYTCIEVAGAHEQSLLLFNDIYSRRDGLASPILTYGLQANSEVNNSQKKVVNKICSLVPEILHIDCSNFDKIQSKETKTIQNNKASLVNFQANYSQPVNHRVDRLSQADKHNGVFFGNNQKLSAQNQSGQFFGGQSNHIQSFLSFGVPQTLQPLKSSQEGKVSIVNDQEINLGKSGIQNRVSENSQQVDALLPKGRIMDIEIWQDYLAVLFEQNLVIVYCFKNYKKTNYFIDFHDQNDVLKQTNKSPQSRKGRGSQKDKRDQNVQNNQNEKSFQQHNSFQIYPIFKSKFKDASDSISQIFFISDFTKQEKINEKNGKKFQKIGNQLKTIDITGGEEETSGYESSCDKTFNSDEQSQNQNQEENKQQNQQKNSEKDQKQSFLQGHFILVESKICKIQQQPLNQKPQSQTKDPRKKMFRKLHIVQIIDQTSQQKNEKNEKNQKQRQEIQHKKQQLSQIDQLTIQDQTSKFIIYNNQNGLLFLLNQDRNDKQMKLVTIKIKKELDGDSDSDENDNQHRYRFEYITEARLTICNQTFSQIQKLQGKTQSIAVPSYLNVLISNSNEFYIYTNILDQVIVYKMNLSDLIPSSSLMMKTLSNNQLVKDNKTIPYKQDSQKREFSEENQFEDEQNLEIKAIYDKIEKEVAEEALQDQIILKKNIKEQLDGVLSGSDKLDSDEFEPSKTQQKPQQAPVSDILAQFDDFDALFDDNFDYLKNKDQVSSPQRFYQPKFEVVDEVVNQEQTIKLQDQTDQKSNKKQVKKEKKNKKKGRNDSSPDQVSNNQEISSIKISQGPQKKKQQEQVIVDNFNELSKKYQELATKTESLVQLFQKQSQQKVEIEQVIKKTVKDQLSQAVLGQQLKEIVLPIILQKVNSIDDVLSQSVIPKIEQKMEIIISKLIEKSNNLHQNDMDKLTPQVIAQTIKQELNQVLISQIGPSIDQIVKSMVSTLDQKLHSLSGQLQGQLEQEELKLKEIQIQYTNSLEWLKLFHKKIAQLSQQMLKDQIIEQQKNAANLLNTQVVNELQTRVVQSLQTSINEKIKEQVSFQLNNIFQNQQRYTNPSIVPNFNSYQHGFGLQNTQHTPFNSFQPQNQQVFYPTPPVGLNQRNLNDQIGESVLQNIQNIQSELFQSQQMNQPNNLSNSFAFSQLNRSESHQQMNEMEELKSNMLLLTQKIDQLSKQGKKS